MPLLQSHTCIAFEEEEKKMSSIEYEEDDEFFEIENNDDEPDDVLLARTSFERLSSMFSRWDLSIRHRPFSKSVVAVVGSTSSGKSSFVNHFFGHTLKLTSEHEQDTHFTIVETVSEKQFAKLVGSSYRALDERQYEELRARKGRAGTASDPLRGHIYLVLDANSSLARYVQFESFSETFRRHQLIETILVNERYVRGDGADVERRKKTLLIDSPGFTSESKADQMEGNLRVLRFIFDLSALTLFMLEANSLALVAGQIAMLEMSLIYSFHGEQAFQRVLAKTRQQYGQDYRFNVLNFFGVVSRYLPSFSSSNSSGDSSASSSSSSPAAASSSSSRHVNGVGADGDVVQRFASSFDRVRFVLTKMDRVLDERRGCAEAQYFELGCLLGKCLKTMRPPVFEQVRGISLPAHMRHRDSLPSHVDPTCDLAELLAEIAALDRYSSFADRLETSIQIMCTELARVISESKIWGTIGHQDSVVVKQLYTESKQRCAARLGAASSRDQHAVTTLPTRVAAPTAVSRLLSYASSYYQ
jgi:Dynamin family